MPPTDVELVRRARAGDLIAFELLYHRYHPFLFRSLLAITRDRGTAEDLLQESFVRAYRNLHRVDETVGSLSPWLHRIALNLAYNWSERRRRRWPTLQTLGEQFASRPATLPEHQTERDELKRAVWHAVQHLEEKHRSVIVMYYLHDMSLAEIAEALDCPRGTVKSRLFYARQQLRRALTQAHPLAEDVAVGRLP